MAKKGTKAMQDNWFVSFFKRNMGILIGLLFLCVILSFATETFFDSDNFITVLRQICINSLLAFGMTYVLIIGGIDLTVGSVVAMSGVLSVMMIESGVPLPVALVGAILSGTVVGLLNGSIVAFTGMPAFIVTLSVQQIVRGFAYIITNGRSISTANETFKKIGNGYLLGIPVPIYIVAVVVIIASVILYLTKFGRQMYAIGGNETAAVFTGIKINRVKIIVYAISGTMAAIAGIILASRMYSGQPTAGQNYESDAIAAAVLGGTSFIGGVGTIGGTIIGALVIGVLSNGLNLMQVTFYWQLVVKGIVILLAVGFDLWKKRKKQ